MEDNEEEDFDYHFPGNAGIGAFDDDIPMEEPEVDVAENDPIDLFKMQMDRQWMYNYTLCVIYIILYIFHLITRLNYNFHSIMDYSTFTLTHYTLSLTHTISLTQTISQTHTLLINILKLLNFI